MDVLNKKSGVEGLSGVSSDFRDLEAAYHEGNPRAIAACEVFAYRVAKYIGAYVAAMNGVDAIAFTAGIGENTSFIREKILAYFVYVIVCLIISSRLDGTTCKNSATCIYDTKDGVRSAYVNPHYIGFFHA